MYYPDIKTFKILAKKSNIVPVFKEMLTDLETPVSAFLKISEDAEHAYLLESVEGQEKIGRYSFLGVDPSHIFKSSGNKITFYTPGQDTKQYICKDPLLELKKLMSRYKPANIPGLPGFFGGAVGYLSYDMVRFFEKLPFKKKEDSGVPEAYFLFTDTILVFDHVKHCIKIVSNAHIQGDPQKAYKTALRKIEELEKKLMKDIRHQANFSSGTKKIRKVSFRSNFTKEKFESAVTKIKKYIQKGEIIQAVPSQRLSIKIDTDPFRLYRALRIINPSPYMYYFKLPEMNIVGSSPEVFLRVEDGKASLRPIAGTRQRGKNEPEDKKISQELLNDEKEKAEHIMLVDLGRNDLGRVCKYGSVRIKNFMDIEKYSHVMHIVSQVEGRVSKGKDAFDCVRACFPAGTVSGAPKIRAMEIIEEVEPTKRGIYAGATGYFSFSGNFDMCITIRTILVRKGYAYIQAGAGIVADSKPENEYYETINKAQALIKAIELAKSLEEK